MDMDTTAKVNSIEKLQELQVAITRFRNDTRQALDAVASELHRIEQWLAERETDAWTEISRAEAALWEVTRLSQQAQHLDPKGQLSLLSIGWEAPVVLRQAQLKLWEARQNYEKIRYWRNALEAAVESYAQQAIPLSDLLENELVSADVTLDKIIKALVCYVSLALLNPYQNG